MIVGQGIAGSLLGWFLKEAGQKVAFIDNFNKGAASSVAAGIINPVTGRRFVKSWMIDELMPKALATYRQLEETANTQFLFRRNILWALSDNQQQNDWYARATDPGYEKFIVPEPDASALRDFCQEPFCWVELKGALNVNLKAVVDFIRFAFAGQGLHYNEPFYYDHLNIDNQSVKYKSITSKKIIFCEGHQSAINPFFKELPYQPAKGEVILVNIPGFKIDKMIKSGVFLVPQGNYHFWVGSSYVWKFLNDQPTSEGRNWLIKKLKEVLNCPFEIIKHKAAIRPVFKDRRPVIGFSQAYPQIGIFNGLGTKGASLGPFWAKHFSDFLTGKIPGLNSEVNVQRFNN